MTGTITALAVAFMIAPLLVVVFFSFHETSRLTLPFDGFSLRWYEEIFQSGEFRDAALNSLIVGLIVAGVTLVLGTLGAFGVSRAPRRLRPLLLALFFLPITLPGLFVGIGLLIYFSRLEYSLSLSTIVVAHVLVALPFYVLIVRTAIERLDPKLEEAAADLGASRPQVFRKVTLPILSPILAGASCLSFALSFDEFIITFFTAGSEQTLPLVVFSKLRRTIDPSVNAIAALLVVATILLAILVSVLLSRANRQRLRGPEVVDGT